MAGNKARKSEKIHEPLKESNPNSKRQAKGNNPAQIPDQVPHEQVRQFSTEGEGEILLNSRSENERINLALQLQRTLGNKYLQRLLSSHTVQAKLTVSQPDDPSEVEADKVAKMVTQTNSQQAQLQNIEEEEEPVQAKIASELQRESPEEEEEPVQAKLASELQRESPEEEEEPVQAKLASELQRESPEEEEEPVQAKIASKLQRESPEEEEEPVQTKLASELKRQPEEDEEPVQAKTGDRPHESARSVENRITASQGNGQSLNESTRQAMEPAFGSDFSDVKVHTNSEADNLSNQLNAEAFTLGRDIYFKQGNYQPDSKDGQELLAHELTHVVQQGNGIQRDISASSFAYDAGTIPVLAQPSDMTCWATVSTMMASWRDGQSYTYEGALAQAGEEYVNMFRNNEGMPGGKKAAFLAAIGLQASPPMNYSIEGLYQLLTAHGPLWATTDEDPSALFAIHARIISGIEGDGTPDGTRLKIIDPAGGSTYDETIRVFSGKYEAVTETGPLRVQIAYF